MSHEDRDDGHDGRDGPDGPQGGSRRGDKAAEGLAPPGREEEIPEPLKLVLADLPASPEDAVRIVPAAGPVAGLRHAPHRGSSEEIDQAQRAQDRDHASVNACSCEPAMAAARNKYPQYFRTNRVKDPSCRRRAMTVLPVEGAAFGSVVTAPWPISPTGSTGG